MASYQYVFINYGAGVLKKALRMDQSIKFPKKQQQKKTNHYITHLIEPKEPQARNTVDLRFLVFVLLQFIKYDWD